MKRSSLFLLALAPVALGVGLLAWSLRAPVDGGGKASVDGGGVPSLKTEAAPVPPNNCCVIPTEPVLDVPKGLRTYTLDELDGISRRIEATFLPDIREKGGRVRFPLPKASLPALLGGLPTGTYTNPDVAYYRDLSLKLWSDNRFHFSPYDDMARMPGWIEAARLPDHVGVIADLGAGSCQNLFAYANRADIVITVDIDPNSAEWIAFLAGRVGAAYPTLGFDRRVVPVTSTATSICLPPVVDLAIMNNMHVFVTDWPPGVDSAATYEKVLLPFFRGVIESLRAPTATEAGGRLLISDMATHRLSSFEALQGFHDLFYPDIVLISRKDSIADPDISAPSTSTLKPGWEAVYERPGLNDRAAALNPDLRRAYEEEYHLAPLDDGRRKRAGGR